MQFRHLPFMARLGLTMLMLVLVGGLAASATHLIWHHENRDDQKGVSYDDIAGAYHGVTADAPLMRAMKANHPPELPEQARKVLTDWLMSGRISEDFDNIDLGDNAPDAIIATNCLSCHNRNSADTEARKIPLEFFDDVRRLAFAKNIKPTDIKILAASTHTHALALGTLSLVLGVFMLGSRFSKGLGSLLIGVSGLSLLVDLGAWWLARDNEIWVKAILVAGPAYAISTGLMCLLSILDLWLPAKKQSE
ncbi:MAG: hypothetical protein KF912_01815 [Phycisphaeraceae bacterium]|nr:hypothetical protein [Phycisphaeraceae bacterium]